jgi:uncharacterized membrane protein YciS (DUF1049 family)
VTLLQNQNLKNNRVVGVQPAYSVSRASCPRIYMIDYLSQLILAGSDHNSETLIDIIIVVFFIVAWVIRTLFLGQKQQSQQQKRPVSNRPSQRTPVTSQKVQAQKDRVEQFLESILQNKKIQQPHPARPIVQKPQMAGIPVPPEPQKVLSVPNKVYTNRPPAIVNTPDLTQPQSHLSSDEALGVSIMDLPTIDTSINSKLEQIPELKEGHIQEDQKHLIHKNLQQKSSVLLLDFSDSENLKRAILYAEILGKPVSMRESSMIIY